VISLACLRSVEGQQVMLSLRDGTVLEDCTLVSVGRLWARTVWLLSGDDDLFIRPYEIADISVFGQREVA
jgi:hypothetical protein